MYIYSFVKKFEKIKKDCEKRLTSGDGVDIGDFLELERALEGYRVVVASSEIEEVARVGEGLRQVAYLVVVLEYL